MEKHSNFSFLQYYFEHKKAPPFEGSNILPFPVGSDIKPLKHRVQELPLAWRTYANMVSILIIILKIYRFTTQIFAIYIAVLLRY